MHAPDMLSKESKRCGHTATEGMELTALKALALLGLLAVPGDIASLSTCVEPAAAAIEALQSSPW